MNLALIVISNHSTTMITMKNLKQSVKVVIVMKVNTTKVKTNDDSSSDTRTNNSGKMPSKTAFVVYWSSLMILSKSCLTCSLLAAVKNVTVKGSQLIVALTCPNNHENIWKSQSN